jgi:Rhs element Vgr protein
MSSNNISTGRIVTFEVKSNGRKIPDSTQVYSIQVEQDVNQVSSATITVLDGGAAEEKFTVSASSVFVPGAKITIGAGYADKNETIFEGIVMKQVLRVDAEIGSALEVVCSDEAIRMTVGRKSSTFSSKKDSDVMSTLIGNSRLGASVSPTSTTLPELVQYYCTDWDFMLARAEVNSMIVTTINGKVTVANPTGDTTSVFTVTYGDNLLSFNAELDATTQLAEVKASGWDYKTQKVNTGQASNDLPGPGNLSSKKLSEVIGLSDFELQTDAPQQSADLTTWSEAQMIKSQFSKIRGDMKVLGTSLVLPAMYITLNGMGDRFNGDHFVSGVSQDISNGNWRTKLTVGMSPKWLTAEPDVMAPPAAGLLPGARGLFNGTVKKMSEDPESEFRILLDIPLFDQSGEGIWARLSNFYSTSGAGAFFLPEVGDEVIVGFLNQDPRFPIILGSMYNSSKIKPYSSFTPAAKNPLKGIVTKSELRVLFDDENKVLTIETPGGNQVVCDDQGQQVLVKDQNGNTVTMSSSGIDLKSTTNITIDATENVSIKGNQGITLESSSGDVQIKGMNVTANAEAEFDAQGKVRATLQGGAEAIVKGAMVMIN